MPIRGKDASGSKAGHDSRRIRSTALQRHEARPEVLPPLNLTHLRHLDVVEPEAEGRPSHLAEASGLAKRGDWVYVVGDENLNRGVFRLSSEAPGELRPALVGKLPTDPDQRTSAKPDLEALVTLPPFPGHPHGLLMGIGSGSGPDRDRGFMWPLASDGSLAGEDEIEGSVVGTITADGAVRRLCTIDRRWKVEGVFAVLDTGVIDLLFCCDQDDPDHGSPLLPATLPYDPRSSS